MKRPPLVLLPARGTVVDSEGFTFTTVSFLIVSQPPRQFSRHLVKHAHTRDRPAPTTVVYRTNMPQRKRNNLAQSTSDDSDRSCNLPMHMQMHPSSLPAGAGAGAGADTDSMNLQEFASLLSEMLDPVEMSTQMQMSESESAQAQAPPSTCTSTSNSTSNSILVGVQEHRKRRRRAPPNSVHFAEEAFLYPSDRTVHDVQESWFTKDDLAVFKKDRKDVVRVLKRAGFDTNAVDKKKYCLRGYEPYFSLEMNKATKYAREMLYTNVFEEQKRQRRLNRNEPETMRECCCAKSQWARGNALELGVLDALESFALSLDLESLQLSLPLQLPLQLLQLPLQLPLQLQAPLKMDLDQEKEAVSTSVPGAYHVDHSPTLATHDTKMRNSYEGSGSSAPGAYHVHVDARHVDADKQSELKRGPEKLTRNHHNHDVDPVEDEHMPDALRFMAY
jgi:hypothetical protein